MKERKKRAIEVKDSLEKQANSAYDAMEKTKKPKEIRDLAAQGNSLRKSATEKQEEISELDKLIKAKLDEIANS